MIIYGLTYQGQAQNLSPLERATILCSVGPADLRCEHLLNPLVYSRNSLSSMDLIIYYTNIYSRDALLTINLIVSHFCMCDCLGSTNDLLWSTNTYFSIDSFLTFTSSIQGNTLVKYCFCGIFTEIYLFNISYLLLGIYNYLARLIVDRLNQLIGRFPINP
jgi:hypothetical protein